MNTTYFKNTIAGNLFGTKTDIAIPSVYYLGLSSTEPQEDGSGVTEVPTDGTGYTRILLAELSVPNNGLVTNTTDLPFPESTADWGRITHYGIFDAQTGGNLLFAGALPKARNIESDTLLSVPAGTVKLRLL